MHASYLYFYLQENIQIDPPTHLSTPNGTNPTDGSTEPDTPTTSSNNMIFGATLTQTQIIAALAAFGALIVLLVMVILILCVCLCCKSIRFVIIIALL